MKVTIDTNVIFQALYSNTGASFQIVKLLREEKIQLSLSIPVFEEYRDVLFRKKTLSLLKLSNQDIITVLDFIVLVGYTVDIHFLLRPNLSDVKDNMFVELAFASNGKYIITSNIKDYVKGNELKFDSFEIVTTGIFIQYWRKYHEYKECNDHSITR